MENTAKIYIMGAAAVVVSSVKLEDWKLVEKYAPEALKIMDKDGEPVFKVMTGPGTGSMNHYGVVWGTYLSEDGNATVTILLDDEVEDKKAAVMDVVGSALLDLIEIENGMPELLKEIHEKTQKIESYISQV